MYFVVFRFARNLFSVLVGLSVLFFAGWRVDASIGISLQMQLGNPSNATAETNNHAHFLIQRPVQALDFSDNLGEPVWASWDLTAGDVGSAARSGSFFTDTNLPPNFYRVTDNDYLGVGPINFNRGHLCPSEDRTDSRADNDMVFFMSNIMPQAAVNNQGVWGTFEGYCRSLLNTNELLIICGPSGFGTNRIPSGKAVIPDYTWKIAVVVPTNGGTALSRITNSTRVIALKIPNTDQATNTWPFYVTSANQIQNDTGFIFFTALPAAIASALLNKVDGQTNPPPAIIAFSPTSGAANTNVIITGANFGSALAVTFNGASAAFSVDSETQITVTVPTNASSGLIRVTTLSGTATSSNNFTVTGSTKIELAILATHTGNFTQGDTSDAYRIVVTNIGTLTSTGTVSVVDALPAGLTTTTISGSGWIANLGTLTCTRSDALLAGAGYPPITVIMSVATNAPASVTNYATVSGGGDPDPAITASDVTAINPTSGDGSAYTGTLAGWDVSGQSNYGPSPLSPGTNAPNVTTAGLTRGSGVGTSGIGAARGWGGTAFTSTTAAAAVAANQFTTFSAAANPGYKVSFSALSKFDYRRSVTGPANGVLQFQIGTGAFSDITNLSYSSTNTSGSSIGAVDVSGFAALQNVGAGTNVTFRIVNYGSTSSGGTWYVFDTANSTAPDLSLQGTVTPVVTLTPIQSWRLQWFGTASNTGIAADNYAVTSDEMPNLLKYALGLSPLVATNNPVIGDISTGYLRLTTPKNPNAADVTLSAIVSGDLTTWTTNGTVVDQDTPTFFQVHDDIPVAGGTNRYIRLRVLNP